MPATYEPIATTTLSATASSITFSSIPNTYTDLRLVVVYKSGNMTGTRMRFNSDTGTNYSVTVLNGSGSALGSFRTTNGDLLDLTVGFSTGTTLAPVFFAVDIFSYLAATNKTVLCEMSGDGDGQGNVTRSAGLYRSTSAINSLTILANNADYSIGTTVTLYGILKA